MRHTSVLALGLSVALGGCILAYPYDKYGETTAGGTGGILVTASSSATSIVTGTSSGGGQGGNGGGSTGSGCGNAGGAGGFTAQWSKRFGNKFAQGASAVAIDPMGNTIVAGHLQDPLEFPTESASVLATPAMVGYDDFFVVVLDPSGVVKENITPATPLGPFYPKRVLGVAAAHPDRIVITGFYKTDDSLPESPKYDVFVQQISPSGLPSNEWVATFGADGNDIGVATAVDPSGNVFVLGTLKGSGMLQACGVPGTVAFDSLGKREAFLAKYDMAGNCIWRSIYKGADQTPSGLAVNADSVVITGGFTGTTVTWGDGHSSVAKHAAMFVVKVENKDGKVVWAQTIQSSTDAGDLPIAGKAVALDGAGNVYTTGSMRGSIEFSSTNNLKFVNIGTNAFVLAQTSFGLPIWATKIGGGIVPAHEGTAVSFVEGSGLYVAGMFNDGLAISLNGSAHSIVSAGNNLFLGRLSPNDGTIEAFDHFGGGEADATRAHFMATRGCQVVLAGAWTAPLDFHEAGGVAPPLGLSDVFVASFMPPP